MRTRWRTDRVAVVAAAVFLGLAGGLYYVIQRGKLGDARLATDKTLLSLLTVTIIGLSLALSVVLVRNLARVLADRRKGVLGARLQARVTFAFLFLALIPSLLLFVGAITVVKRSLKASAPPDQARTLAAAAELAEDFRRQAAQRAAHFAGELARDCASGPLSRIPWSAGGEVVRRLDEFRRRADVDAVGIAPATGTPLAAALPRLLQPLRDPRGRA